MTTDIDYILTNRPDIVYKVLTDEKAKEDTRRKPAIRAILHRGNTTTRRFKVESLNGIRQGPRNVEEEHRNLFKKTIL